MAASLATFIEGGDCLSLGASLIAPRWSRRPLSHLFFFEAGT